DWALQRLVGSQIVLPGGSTQDGAYAFRHALIQDAAYQSLLLSRRRRYHQEIAQALVREFPETAESQPNLVAQHYTSAALPEQAIPYWRRAGERASAGFAYREPVAHFEQGLQLARGLPESVERSRQILGLLLLLGETRAQFNRIQEALQTFKDAAEL